jgi:uncharacterized membrane protein HdeD (DUF308 family)
MKEKQKNDVITAGLLLIVGIILLLIPSFLKKIPDTKLVCVVVFGIFGLINLIRYFINRSSKDIEGILNFFANLVAILSLSFVHTENTPMDLSIVIMIWIILMSLIKLKKADYYHDRRDRMWKINIFMLVVFIITGLLTAINLGYTPKVQIIILGYFFLVNGILQMIDPIVKSLISHG